MKVVFFGTSNVALPVLEQLNIHMEVAAVITSPDKPVGRKQEMEESPVSVLAKELQLNILKPEKVKANTELLEQLKRLEADIFVVVSYGKILPEEIISLPRLKTVNVHFSLLPQYRGPSPIQYALLAGQTLTGTTIFILDDQIDHGPILAQKEAPVDSDDNFFTLSEKLAHMSANMIIGLLEDYEAGKITPQPQNHEAATFTKIIAKEDGKINWSNDAVAIYNQFRAFYMWPGIWSTWQGKKIKITDCSPITGGTSENSPGTVLEDGIVACGNNTLLKINRLLMEGKKEMSIKEFENGYKEFTGSTLT